MTATEIGVVIMGIGGGMIAFAVFLLVIWCVVRVVKLAWRDL